MAGHTDGYETQTRGLVADQQKQYDHGERNAFILRELFTYHTPTPDQQRQYAAIRSAAKHFAEIVLDNTPPSSDQSTAIRKIREAVMTANAAVALNGVSL